MWEGRAEGEGLKDDQSFGTVLAQPSRSRGGHSGHSSTPLSTATPVQVITTPRGGMSWVCCAPIYLCFPIYPAFPVPAPQEPPGGGGDRQYRNNDSPAWHMPLWRYPGATSCGLCRRARASPGWPWQSWSWVSCLPPSAFFYVGFLPSREFREHPNICSICSTSV